MIAALLCLLALPNLAGDDGPDVVVLRDGGRVEGRVLFENDEKVVLREKSKTREIARGEVGEVQSVERSLAEYLKRFDALDPTDVAALVDLAHYAEEHHLPGEARCTWIRILTVDAAHEEAWAKLGGVQRNKGWELKVKGRFYTIDELRTRTSDWKNALELPTAHFVVKTDTGPERALEVALDVERACTAYYEVVGKPLELWVFDEVPEIHLHAEAKEYPAPPTPGDPAWFGRGENTLHVLSSQSLDRGLVVAEFVDALVFNSFRRSLGNKTGELEPWVREGLRQAFAAAVRPDPGHVRFEFGEPIAAHFHTQATAEKPVALEAVLTAGRNAFSSGTNAARLTAAAYTLTQFLIQGRDHAHRAAFADFLRSSYTGKGGKSNFLHALDMKEKDLEAEWTAYVKEVAGA